jgi:hypothetical protein
MAGSRWHYLVRRGLLSQDALNELGKDGWDLVAVSIGDGEPALYFKRPHPTLTEAITLEQRERYFAEWGVTPEPAS